MQVQVAAVDGGLRVVEGSADPQALGGCSAADVADDEVSVAAAVRELNSVSRGIERRFDAQASIVDRVENVLKAGKRRTG